ncbi:MAG TPA: biopolymer transporter ExbD [Pirellulales bacterium]|jgi:biopolymer transport protein ExbD
MSGSMNQGDRAEPNLVPVLDMVFQLITFFMLVFNLKAASVDLNLELPVIGSAMPSDSDDSDVMVLNINKDGRLSVYGEEKNVDAYIAQEAQMALRRARLENPEAQAGDELPRTVIIRADKATPFGLLNHVIRSCQSQGFRKFQYRAMSAAPEA